MLTYPRRRSLLSSLSRIDLLCRDAPLTAFTAETLAAKVRRLALRALAALRPALTTAPPPAAGKLEAAAAVAAAAAAAHGLAGLCLGLAMAGVGDEEVWGDVRRTFGLVPAAAWDARCKCVCARTRVGLCVCLCV